MDQALESMRRQCTQHIAMVRPAAFQFNAETAGSNSFQNSLQLDKESLFRVVQKEFDQMVQQLEAEGVKITVWQDSERPVKPDAIFPKNWVSFHQSGEMLLYPMLAANRRLERDEAFIQELMSHRRTAQRIDLSAYEQKDQFLEGTGSMILDRVQKWAFAARSPRTHDAVFEDFIKEMGYQGIAFDCADLQGYAIYHTNVMMALGNSFAVLAEDYIPRQEDRDRLRSTLNQLGKEVISISPDQVNQFCGNIIELQDEQGQALIVLSESAFKAFTESQLRQLKRDARLCPIAIPTIEAIGGGSVRCMILELF